MVKQAELPTAPVADPASKDITDVHRALARLPHRQRLLVVLRYYLDLSFEEMGQTLHISVQAAKSRLHRVLHRLRVEVPEVLEDE